MTYNGMELEEVKEPQVFDEPREMLAWGSGHPTRRFIVAILPGGTAVDIDRNWLSHCAFVPEKAAPRRATNRELSKWLAQGNGEWCLTNGTGQIGASTNYGYSTYEENKNVIDGVLVRKWDDADWNEPTLKYLELEDK